MMRRLSRFFVLLASTLCLLALTPAAGFGKPLRVVVLTDVAGLGDKGFNDVCWQGVQRARQDFGLSAQFIQSREQADYAANLSLAAQNAEAVVTLGYLYVDAVKQVAPRFPEVYFVHIEGDISGPNVASFDFKSEEGGFLGGLVAGFFTKSKKVGVVSGMDIPPVVAYVSGFQAGMKTAEKRRGEPLETIVTSVGSFNDPVKGKSLALTLLGRGTDVIFRAAGNSGIGVLEALKDASGITLVAEDLDLDAEYPGKVLTSTLKRMDVAVYGALQDIVKGSFQGGHRWLGAADGAVDITEMKYSRQFFKAHDLESIERARKLLKDDKLVIPRQLSEVDAFNPPEL
jgi:basic membrane protein A and related proteins